jgi:tetratricopeptide (TPR) repeat protein
MLLAIALLVILCSTLSVVIYQMQTRHRQAFAAVRGEEDEAALQALLRHCMGAHNHGGSAETLLRLAMLKVQRGEVGQAEEMLRGAVKAAPEIGVIAPSDLLPYLDSQIALLRRTGNLRAAEEPMRRALSVATEAGKPRLEQAMRRFELGQLLQDMGRHQDAEELLAAVCSMTPEATSLDGHHAASLGRARALLARGQLDEAEALLRTTLGHVEASLSASHPAAMACRAELVELYRMRGQHDPALAHVRAALSQVEATAGPDAPALLPLLLKEASVLGDAARFREAEAPLLRALTLQKNLRGPQHPEVAELSGMLGDLYQLSGRYEEAEPTLRRALKQREEALGPDHPQLTPHLGRLYQLLKTEGRYYEAEEVQRRILALRERMFGPEHPCLVDTLDELIDLQGRAGTPVGAVPFCERALAIRQASLGGEHPELALRLVVLAHMRRGAGQLLEAQQLYLRAITQLEHTYGDEHLNLLPVLLGLGSIHFSRQEYERAHQLAQRALLIAERALGRHHRTTVECGENTAAALEYLGRPGDAIAVRRRYTPEAANLTPVKDSLLN